jgi:hypothetical protein
MDGKSVFASKLSHIRVEMRDRRQKWQKWLIGVFFYSPLSLGLHRDSAAIYIEELCTFDRR